MSTARSSDAFLEIMRLINTLPDGPERHAALSGSAVLDHPDEVARLLDTVRLADDPSLVQASQRSLAGMTNAGVLWLVMGLYRCTDDPGQQDRLLGVLHQSRQEALVAPLISATDRLGVRSSDPLILAILDALALIGSPPAVNYLVDRLNTAVHAGEDTLGLSAAIGRIKNPAALLILLSAASGERPYVTMEARVAATRALGRHEWAAVGPTLSTLAQTEADSRLLYAAQEAIHLSRGK